MYFNIIQDSGNLACNFSLSEIEYMWLGGPSRLEGKLEDNKVILFPVEKAGRLVRKSGQNYNIVLAQKKVGVKIPYCTVKEKLEVMLEKGRLVFSIPSGEKLQQRTPNTSDRAFRPRKTKNSTSGANADLIFRQAVEDINTMAKNLGAQLYVREGVLHAKYNITVSI